MEPRSLDDSATWYRPAGGYDSTGVGTTSRRPARPGYYTPEDDFTGTGIGERISIGERTGRSRSRRGGGPGGPDGGGPRDPAEPDDQQRPLVLRILLRIWRGSWWRRWTWKKAGLLVSGIAAMMVLVIVASFFVVLHNTVVPIAQLSQPLNQSSLVYFSDGKVVGCFCSADRTVLTQQQIQKSKLLVAAVLAAEDRKFFTEGGVSLTGILRAAKADLSGSSFQGGSTITEQFVKTYFDPTGNGNLTYSEKIKEIFIAIKLAKLRPKTWILWHYLNAIPLGAGANGVQAAAETYFGVKAWQLTASQAAMIAAMIQAPYGYEPTDPSAPAPGLGNSLVQRWIYVLTNMVRDGAITQAKMNQIVPDPSNLTEAGKDFPKVTIHSPDSSWPGYRGYIMQLVVNEMQAYYGYGNLTTAQALSKLGEDGLQIHTTISEHMMDRLYSAVAENKRYMAELGVRMPDYVNISAVLEQPRTGKIVAFYGGPGYGLKHCTRVHCQNNTILAPEPVGSSFKPYVLATAVSQGMNVQTSVMNSHSPLCIPPDWNTTYQHQLAKQTMTCTQEGYWLFNEASENYPINLNVTEATALSNDPAYEDLIHRTTVQDVINLAQTLGVSPTDVANLNAQFGNGCQNKHPGCTPGSVISALGSGSLTAVDQANTFADFVSGGMSATPHVISYIVKSSGLKIPAHVVRTRALQPEVAGDVDYALSFDTSSFPGLGTGTGYPNAVWDRPFIAKTGTLGTGDSSSQAWFVGAIPQYSLAVGMFTDRPNGKHQEILDVLPKLGPWLGGYGGAWPAHIWHTFMSENFTNLKVESLPPAGYAGDNPLFSKWVMAAPVKKKKKNCKQQPGQGHGHGWFANHGKGGQNCQKNPNGGPSHSPSPSPSQSSSPTSPSPSPTPTPSSPTPTPTPSSPTPTSSPSPSSSSHSPFPGPGDQKAPAPKVPAAETASVIVQATVPDQVSRRAGWVAATSLG
jgi:membrane peptidoglycan carboxypeptidase